MIISRTPHRVSFFGGGTDYPGYYLEHGGKVLGVTINKYCYLNVRKLPLFDHKHRIVYSKIENINNIDDINHPSVRETLRHLSIDYGISIHHDGDIPARSGMGSSSAFTVGLINSLYALEGKRISRDSLRDEAIYIEQKLIEENVGSQDQTWAAFGGLNRIQFLPNGEIAVEPAIMETNRLKQFESSLMLFFSGISRTASDIAGEQIEKTSVNTDNLNKMKSMVDEAYEVLVDATRDLDDFGRMLNETWQLKKSLSSKISNPQIEEMYERALTAGALGGKLLGAGGGGFMLFYAPPAKQEAIRQALTKYLNIPFEFDFEGSKIVIYRPD